MEKAICIHCHFYQPPRENPWLEAVEYQDSAAPYHDWNERICAECYAPNATARILDANDRIKQIVNNYTRISFNFGPTLLSWLQEKEPEVHQAIVLADQESRRRFAGHGSAMAQVYNHMILPLANQRDKYTQVLWGIRDFEFRFGRPPEGMWLSETAVCTQSLEMLAQCGIKFTILSPYQAQRIRELGTRNWRDVSDGRLDPTRPYNVILPSGRKLAVFFYDGPISRAVAFEGLLLSGERLANRLLSAFSDRRNRDQLVNIATDGETYGHHFGHGEMALAYALDFIEKNNLARLTNYAEYLEKHPPTHEVQIIEKSSWSCPHGVGRWMIHCGCNSGQHANWNQHWRAPLRFALDWLRDAVGPLFETKGRALLKDPWQARNDYISIILDRSTANRDQFYSRHACKKLDVAEQETVLELMELQRHAMLMYTSCGWFFDELSGLETVQVIQYAARVVQLARGLFGQNLEPEFLKRLEQAKSNIPAHGSGRQVYEKFVRPAMIDWKRVVAHYAVSSLFESYAERTQIFLYGFEEQDRQVFTAGKAKLAVGHPKVSFEITRKSDHFAYAILYMGEHNLTGGVRRFLHEETYHAMVAELKAAFDKADFPQVIRLMDHHFGDSYYSLKSLFKDEQRKILDIILASTREDLENRYRRITEQYTPLINFLKDLNAPFPSALQTASDFILEADLVRALTAEPIDLEHLRALCDESHKRNMVFDADLSYVVTQQLEKLIRRLAGKPEKLLILAQLEKTMRVLGMLPIRPHLVRVQNAYFEMLKGVLPAMQTRANKEDKDARVWMRHFLALGEHLNFALPASSHEYDGE